VSFGHDISLVEMTFPKNGSFVGNILTIVFTATYIFGRTTFQAIQPANRSESEEALSDGRAM
jgi:hypothetical protein